MYNRKALFRQSLPGNSKSAKNVIVFNIKACSARVTKEKTDLK